MKLPRRVGWKTKLFGDTPLNFYGWCVTGLMVVGGSLWFMLLALRAGAGRSPTSLMLGAVYFVLLGHFGIAIQEYMRRVASTLDAAEAPKDSDGAQQ